MGVVWGLEASRLRTWAALGSRQGNVLQSPNQASVLFNLAGLPRLFPKARVQPSDLEADSDANVDATTEARIERSGSTTVELAQPTTTELNLTRAFQAAEQAAGLAQTARTVAEWEQVGQAWLEAIALLRAVPPDSPFRVFAQQKAQEYQRNWAVASQRADSLSAPYVFPSLGNQTLDSQLANYLSYV
ncbi:MAG: hypothetical protein AAGF24_12450, partial [Cyanobacteria bacterium P01_H01_bin.121]